MFGCTMCGACCRRVGLVINKLKEKWNFPYDVKENGECEKLIDKKCSVYENRPDICRIDKMMQQTTTINKKEYYYATTKKCNDFIKEDRMGEKFLIDEKQYQ